MPEIRIDFSRLGDELARFERRFPKAVERGLVAAAHRARRLMVQRHSSGRYPVYLGQMRAGWAVRRVPGGAEMYNDAPHAGIVEEGARPHKVSKEGREAIKRWVLKKLGASLSSIANQEATARFRKLTKGAGRGRVGDAVRTFAKDMRQEAAKSSIERQADAITWGIVEKLRAEGQKGLFVLKKSMPEIEKYIGQEVDRALDWTTKGGGGDAGAR